MKDIIRNCFSRILDLIYPNLCLHCFSKLEKNYFYFCKDCLYDFSYLYTKKARSTFAVFENKGSIKTLLKELQRQKILSITKIVASFIVIQLFRLNWPMPDIVYPISNLLKKDHLSKEVSILLKKPLRKKQDLSKIALIVLDVIDIEKVSKMKKQLLFKKVYVMGLCFDVFFDDLDLFL